jgi:hypothetical protein
METTYLEHPTEEVLERFLLNQASQQEDEAVETHFLGCPPCAGRLEKLEIELTVLKSALQSFENERRDTQAARAARARLWQSWFTVRKLSLTGAGAFAAVALGTFFLPEFAAEDMTLSANRGIEVQVVSEHHPLRLHLIAPNVSDGPVSVELVDGNGTQLWTARTVATNHRVDVRVPALSISGTHFLRLSTSEDRTAQPEPLQEYSLEVR